MRDWLGDQVITSNGENESIKLENNYNYVFVWSDVTVWKNCKVFKTFQFLFIKFELTLICNLVFLNNFIS